MNAPLSRNSGRGLPVSPARAAPFVTSRSLVVQSPGPAGSGYYQAETWSSPGSTGSGSRHYQAETWSSISSTAAAHLSASVSSTSSGPAVAQSQSRSLNYTSYAHGRSTGTGASQSFIGNLTAVAVPAGTTAIQAADPRLGLGGAALTSPRCESPTKGPYGMAKLATQALMSEVSSPPTAVALSTVISSGAYSEEMLTPCREEIQSPCAGGGSSGADVPAHLRRGLAARAAASLQSRANNRRGSSMDSGPRSAPGASERSLSAGIRCKADPVPVRSSRLQTRHGGEHDSFRPRTSASSSSALPTLSSAEVLLRDGSRENTVVDSGSSTVPLPYSTPQYQPTGPTRSVSANVSVLSNLGSPMNSPMKAVAGSAEPEAEPAANLTAGSGSFNGKAVPRTTPEEPFSPFSPLQKSANVELNDEGNLNLHVRILPSELISWRELQIMQPISTGSFGEVFLARHKDREVSVKRCILGEGGSMTKEQLHNLEREINTYRTLNHPNIVKYIGCVLEHPNLAIVTEYVPNGNVFDLLFMHRVNLPAAIRLKIASQVAVALNYMHNCDPIVIHRDLKTQNLVLEKDYSVKLCDFGKTQLIEEDTALPLHQDSIGSPRYMAPECFQPGAYITEKMDIWSLGCCLVEILGGPLPFEDTPQMSTVVNLILQHRQTPLVPPWFAPEVQPMLAGCFDFEPQLRIPISEVLLALRRLTPEQMQRHGMDKRRVC